MSSRGEQAPGRGGVAEVPLCLWGSGRGSPGAEEPAWDGGAQGASAK